MGGDLLESEVQRTCFIESLGYGLVLEDDETAIVGKVVLVVLLLRQLSAIGISAMVYSLRTLNSL